MANQRDDSGHPVILTGSIGNNYQARGGACIRANESSYLCRSSWSEDALSSGTLASRVPGSAPALTPLRLASEGSPLPCCAFSRCFHASALGTANAIGRIASFKFMAVTHHRRHYMVGLMISGPCHR